MEAFFFRGQIELMTQHSIDRRDANQNIGFLLKSMLKFSQGGIGLVLNELSENFELLRIEFEGGLHGPNFRSDRP